MYQPAHFRMGDVPLMHGVIAAHPLATLVTPTASGFSANHIPFYLQPSLGENGVLQGHVARANPVWQELVQTGETLAIFQGPQCYITPSWYPTKQEHGQVVPTWNYVVVHVWGRLRVRDDPVWVREQVQTLTGQQESGFAAPWAISEAPAEYINKMLAAIVGIELTITRIEGKNKTSQNQPEANRQGVVQGLKALGTDQATKMAEWAAQK